MIDLMVEKFLFTEDTDNPFSISLSRNAAASADVQASIGLSLEWSVTYWILRFAPRTNVLFWLTAEVRGSSAGVTGAISASDLDTC